MQPLKWNEANESTASDYRVTIKKVRGKTCGYPQCSIMWHMQFSFGGWNASAFHESRGAARCNAARIVGYMRGTCDVFGNDKAAA